jgi:hypothetical protein
MSLALVDGEQIMIKSPASLERDPIRHDGQLVLTDRRLHFSGIEQIGWTYWLDEFVEIKINNVLWILAQGMSVSFQDGFTEIILVHNREDWVAKILEAKAAFGAVNPAKDPLPVEERRSAGQRMQLRVNSAKCIRCNPML